MTTIGPNTRINGRIEGDADVVVEGRVDGTISLTQTLTVAEGGFVSGDIEADILVIEGFASGTLRASTVVHLTSTAQVEGEIFAAAVRLDPGAKLRGRVEMDVDAAPPRPARPARAERRPAERPQPRREAPKARPAPAAAPEPVVVREPEPEPEPVRVEAPAPAVAPEPVQQAHPKAEPRADRSSEPKPAKQPARKPAPAKTQTLEIDPDELTVKELREMLTERGLALSGTKSELVQRLRTGE